MWRVASWSRWGDGLTCDMCDMHGKCGMCGMCDMCNTCDMCGMCGKCGALPSACWARAKAKAGPRHILLEIINPCQVLNALSYQP